jgi:hypothetical protein
VRFAEITDDSVQGTVYYDSVDSDEKQDFRWRITEDAVPSESAFRLVRLIRDEKLLHSDRLRISRDELRKKFAAVTGHPIGEDDFSEILDEVERVQIWMLDDGLETDYYFIHE